MQLKISLQVCVLVAVAPCYHPSDGNTTVNRVSPERVQHKPLAVYDLVVLYHLPILRDIPVEHAAAGIMHVLHDKIICRLGHLLAGQMLLLQGLAL